MARNKKRKSLMVALKSKGFPNAYLFYKTPYSPVLDIVRGEGDGQRFWFTRRELRTLAKRINSFLEATK